MNPLNHALVRRALVFLNTRRFTFLTRGRFKAADRNFTTAEAMQLAFCDWMSHVESLADGSVQDRILDWIGSRWWEQLAFGLEQADRKEWPSMTACFTFEQRYVLLEGRMKWYDIYEGRELLELPKRPKTMLICDITAVWADVLDRMEPPHDPSDQRQADDRAGSNPPGMGRPG